MTSRRRVVQRPMAQYKASFCITLAKSTVGCAGYEPVSICMYAEGIFTNCLLKGGFEERCDVILVLR